jgi:outer membrane protein assembly factor BamA
VPSRQGLLHYKAAVKPSSEQLPDKRGAHQFVVKFDIDAGPQYRLGQIGFRNNRVVSSEQLRSMFKLASGDIFSLAKVRQGLDQMHRAYVERGYLKFASVPDATIDESSPVISVVVDSDEGKQVR